MAKIVLTLPKSLQKPPEAPVKKPIMSKGLPVPSKAAVATKVAQAAPSSSAKTRGRPLGSTKEAKAARAEKEAQAARAEKEAQAALALAEQEESLVPKGVLSDDIEALREEIDKRIAARLNNPPPIKTNRMSRFRNHVRSNEFLPLVERYATMATERAIHFLESIERRSVETERPDPFQTFPISLMESKALNDAIRIMQVKLELEKRSIEAQRAAVANGKHS